MVVEPLVQGAAGMLVHPPATCAAVRELCDRHGVLLICDEVATGFGRTGTMFACEQEGVCAATSSASPRASPAATCRSRRPWPPSGSTRASSARLSEYRTFFHGHTYTGNPLACAAALASLDVFEQERTLERLQPKIRLLGELLAPVEAMPEVAEVRRRGFMVGIDLGEHDPALRLGHRVTLEARERGAIIRPLGDVVVLMPPLSISKPDLRRLVEIVAESIRAAYPVAELDAGAKGGWTRPFSRLPTPRTARSPPCGRRRPGRTSRRECPRTRFPAGSRRRDRPRPGRR